MKLSYSNLQHKQFRSQISHHYKNDLKCVHVVVPSNRQRQYPRVRGDHDHTLEAKDHHQMVSTACFLQMMFKQMNFSLVKFNHTRKGSEDMNKHIASTADKILSSWFSSPANLYLWIPVGLYTFSLLFKTSGVVFTKHLKAKTSC